jgi:hypothetical protein
MFARSSRILAIDAGPNSANAVVLRKGRQPGEPMVVEAHEVFGNQSSHGHWAEAFVGITRKMGTWWRECAVSFWPTDSKLRVFEAPAGVGGLGGYKDAHALFNEDVSNHVIACGPVSNSQPDEGSAVWVATAVPAECLQTVAKLLERRRCRLTLLQLKPVAILNAFTNAYPEITTELPFVLVDLDETRTTLAGGCLGAVRSMRVLEHDRSGAGSQSDLEARLREVVPEVLGLCDYVEGRDQHHRLKTIHVSGPLSKSAEFLTQFTRCVEISCTPWNPLRGVLAADSALVNGALLEHLPFLAGAAGVGFQQAAA